MNLLARAMQPLLRLLGLVIICASFYYAATEEVKIAVGNWLHVPSLVFVGGMLLGICLTSFQWVRIVGLLYHLCLTSPSRLDHDSQRLSRNLKAFSDAYYAHGPEGLRAVANRQPLPPVWSKVVSQLEARIPIADIRSLLQYAAQTLEDEVNSQISLASSLSAVAPSIGLLGTVLGLIRLLSNLADIGKLGPNMALALVTALYGIFLSVIVLNPVVTRLQAVRDGLLKTYQQALFWVYLIEQRKPSFYCDD